LPDTDRLGTVTGAAVHQQVAGHVEGDTAALDGHAGIESGGAGGGEIATQGGLGRTTVAAGEGRHAADVQGDLGLGGDVAAGGGGGYARAAQAAASRDGRRAGEAPE